MSDGFEDLVEGVAIVATLLLGEKLIQNKQNDRPTEEQRKENKKIDDLNKQDALKEAQRIINQQGKAAQNTPANPVPGPKFQQNYNAAPRPAQKR